MSKRVTTEEFIKRAREIHGDKYDYSKAKYTSKDTKVCIICPKHGEFWVTPKYHIKGYGCQKCLNEKKQNEHYKEFIEKARQIHGNKYDYSKVEYKNIETKICIMCSMHGEFWQRPKDHLQGNGCPKCGLEKSTKTKRMTTKDFIEKSIKTHGNKYDYSKVEYKGKKIKVCIICPIHGEFWQLPNNHIQGMGCKKCGGNEKHTTEEIIEMFKKVHNDKYDYSKVEYTNARTEVEIMCRKHGSFFQKPSNHLNGQGCPHCLTSKLEIEIKDFFTKKEIEFIGQYRSKWLKQQSLDLFIPSKNIAVECQGRQHFEITDYFGGEKGFMNIIERDERKRKLCEEHGIKILYYSNLGIDYPYHVFEDKEELLKEILK